MDGISLAKVLASFAHRPQIVFVTAYDEHAVDAFELRAVDYVMKPVRAARLAEAVGRLYPAADSAEAPDETVPVELGGVTRFVRRSQVRFVEAQGDYARLHTAEGSHLVRRLPRHARAALAPGFVRIHRSTLISLAHVRELQMIDGRCTVLVDDVPLAVSRRHTRDLRERLMHRREPVSGRERPRMTERVRITHPRTTAARPVQGRRRPARSTS